MKTLGLHILVEISGCQANFLDNVDKIRELMIKAAIAANAHVKEAIFHKFSPVGVSGVVVIAESHISIHTWPEYGYAAVDIYTCGENTDPWKACEIIAEGLKAKSVYFTEVERGIPSEGNRFIHTLHPVEEVTRYA
ncbi:MAG: adenosylmethionine decarboxylase [bacterium]